MTLAEWLRRIEALRPERINLGLGRVADVAARLGISSLPGNIITVAGTNGKGSTVALLDSLAQGMGLTTAVYTSPHLFHFAERIRLHDRQASETELCDAFSAVESVRGDVPLTYFEFTTLAAFWLFHQAPTDLYILEVGLGGRLDAVNLLDADVAVITSIGLDHTDWLGDTREAIGREKAGIARAGRPLIYGEENMPETVAEVAAESDAQLLRAGRDFGVTDGQVHWQSGVMEFVTPVRLGADNLAAALAALACLGLVPDASVIMATAATASLPGRCETLHWQGHEWVFDVAHNREAMTRLASSLSAYEGRTLGLAGMLADKPAEALLALASRVDDWFIASLPGPRGGAVERFQPLLPRAYCFPDLAGAVAAVHQALNANDRVVVVGSFVTVSEVQKLLGFDSNIRRAG
jgi:dihydrofolate synthase/folylpolyglutamate synthase